MDIYKLIELTANVVTIAGFILGIKYVSKIYNIISDNINIIIGKVDKAYIIKYFDKAQIINMGYAEKDLSDKIYPKKDNY